MILAYLDWQDEVAPIERQLRIRERPPAPSELEVYARRPDLTESLAIALRAWQSAASERSIGMGIGPIPQSAIDAWCDRHGIDQQANDYLTDALRYVDGIVMQRSTKGSPS